MIYRNPLWFRALNSLVLSGLALLSLLPLVHIFMISVSGRAAVEGNLVGLVPVDFHLENYREILTDARVIRAFSVSFSRVLIGTSVQMFFIVTIGYPLAREHNELGGRTLLMWFIVFPMLFQGGLIPTFLLIRNLGLLNSFWALVIGPISVQVFSVVLMMNFFRTIPRSLYESALLDGASHWRVLGQIYIPLARPAIATLTLFSIVSHWNNWFDGLIYLNDPSKWPLQTFLRTLLVAQMDQSTLGPEELARLSSLSNRSFKAAQVFVATVPILLVYPFMQKHFVKGIVLGSVKE
jgi:putative aldouronate transport system permease protein